MTPLRTNKVAIMSHINPAYQELIRAWKRKDDLFTANKRILLDTNRR